MATIRLMGGSLSSDGMINDSVINIGGTVNAGNSPGTLTIDGDYSQTGSGQLLIEIAGIAPGLFDLQLVSGTATLGGSLNVELLGSPTINVGEKFDVLSLADSWYVRQYASKRCGRVV